MSGGGEAPTAAGPRRRPRDRKQQILTAARDLFVAHGYPNVSMAQIAEQVGITAGALYRHFANKAVLLEKVVAENFAWIDEPVERAEYDYAIEDAISRVVDRPYLSDLWIHEIRYLPGEAQSDLRRRMRAWDQSLIPALRLERPDLDDGQAVLLAWAVQSLMSCIGRQALRQPVSVRLPAIRLALRAIVRAELVPTGELIERDRVRLWPLSMRERLLAAAAEQFGDRGYHDTSMVSIAAAADVTGPNLYIYFESKADLLRAVLDRSTHALWLGLDQALLTSTTPTESLQRLVTSYIALSRTWAAILEDPTGVAELEETTTATQREYVAEWVGLLQQIFPGLDERAAKVRVQLTLFLVSDLHRTGRVAQRTSFVENVKGLALAILLDETAL